MSIHLEKEDLFNVQQLEVAVSGPDGATHLILCTGAVNVDPACCESYTFFVGPRLSRRQFVGVIVSGALSQILAYDQMFTEGVANNAQGLSLVRIEAAFDEEMGRVRVKAEVSTGVRMTKIAISYNVNILAELQKY